MLHLVANKRLDLTLMGIGQDGHAASPLPALPALDEVRRENISTTKPEANASPIHCLILTLPMLHGARWIVLIASWANQAQCWLMFRKARKIPKAPAQFFLRDDPFSGYPDCGCGSGRLAAIEIEKCAKFPVRRHGGLHASLQSSDGWLGGDG